jgi:hypothetical protein
MSDGSRCDPKELDWTEKLVVLLADNLDRLGGAS